MSSNFIQKSLKKYSQIYNYYVLIICFLSTIVKKEIYAIVLIAILTIFIFRNNWKISIDIPGKFAYLYFGITGIIVGIMYLAQEGHTTHSFIKHLFYFIYTLCFILLGIMIPKMKKTTRENIMSSLMLFFMVYSVADIIEIAVKLSNQTFTGLSEYRDIVGTGSIYPILGLYFLLFFKEDIKIIKLSNKISMLIFILSGFIHFSRTYIGVFVILVVFSGVLKKPQKVVKALIIISVIFFLFTLAEPYLLDLVLEKFVYSFSEISARTQEWDWQMINHNWRGYELYCELIKFKKSNILEQFIGGGFGTTLDVFGYAYLVTDEPTIPFLHNGYGTMLMVWGIVGVIVYILMILSLIKYSYRSSLNRDRRFALGMSFSLLFASYVIGTVLFSADTSKWIFFLLLILNSTPPPEKDRIRHHIKTYKLD